MRRRIYLLLIALFFLPSLACGNFITNYNYTRGSGTIVTQTIDVSDFDRISLESQGNVFIKQGQTESLTIEADDNILPLLETNVIGHELVLSTKPNVDIDPSQAVVYTLTVKDLREITLKGSGDFMVDALSTDDLSILVSGSGDVNLEDLLAKGLTIRLSGSGDIFIGDMVVQAVSTDLTGSGEISLQGSADSQEVRVDGSGNYQAGDLETLSTEIDMSGSADITLWVTDQLDVSGNGSGDIRYYGDPNTDQSGSGSIHVQSLGEK